MNLVNYIKEIPTKPYKALVSGILFLSLFILSSCNRIQFNNQSSCITILYSKEHQGIIKILENKFAQNNHFKFDKIDREKSKELLLKNPNSIYIGSIDSLIESDDEINKILIAKDSLIFVVNPINPIRNISKVELYKIFFNSIKNWNKLTDFNQSITIINKDISNEDRQSLASYLQKDKINTRDYQFEVNSDEEAISLVQKYENALAYISYSSLDNRVKSINIDNISPSKINISSGTFPLYKLINLYYSSNLFNSDKAQEITSELTDYLWSNEFKKELNNIHLVALSEAELQVLKENSKAVKIGVSAPISGPYIDLGKAIINGARLAVREHNKSKGLKEKAIELIICDDKAEISTAIKCANKFVKEKVVGVIGHLNSQISIETSKIYLNNNIVQISPGSTHPWFTNREEAKGKVFRTIDIDEKQAETIAKAISKLEKEKSKRIAILHNGTIYGSNLATLIENYVLRYLDQNTKIESHSFSVSERHFHKVFKKSTPTLIIFIGEYADAAQMLVDLALDNKSGITFFGADGNFSRRFIDLAGLKAEGSYVVGCNIQNDNGQLDNFIKTYKKSFKSHPGSFSIYSYDAGNILINAINKVNLDKSKQLGEVIQNTEMDTLCGALSFDEKGNPKQTRMAIFKVENAKFIKADL